MIRTPEDIKRLRDIVRRLKELGIPQKTLNKINKWIDGLAVSHP
jgi:hypothetical protein